MIQVNKETAVPFHFYLIFIVTNQFHTREAPSGITRTHYSELRVAPWKSVLRFVQNWSVTEEKKSDSLYIYYLKQDISRYS